MPILCSLGGSLFISAWAADWWIGCPVVLISRSGALRFRTRLSSGADISAFPDVNNDVSRILNQALLTTNISDLQCVSENPDPLTTAPPRRELQMYCPSPTGLPLHFTEKLCWGKSCSFRWRQLLSRALLKVKLHKLLWNNMKNFIWLVSLKRTREPWPLARHDLKQNLSNSSR